ncbi:MAG: hypothetical protein QM796_09120 [Chthoniobacteraceae bacterium]
MKTNLAPKIFFAREKTATAWGSFFELRKTALLLSILFSPLFVLTAAQAGNVQKELSAVGLKNLKADLYNGEVSFAVDGNEYEVSAGANSRDFRTIATLLLIQEIRKAKTITVVVEETEAGPSFFSSYPPILGY